MELKSALKGQYRAALAMLREAVEVCPDDLWVAGKPPRSFNRIAYHTIFYTHFYLAPSDQTFEKWPKTREKGATLWDVPDPLASYTPAEIIDYIELVESKLDALVDALDLDAADCGFPWYKGFSKLEHQLVNLRHVQGHVGQLSELLMARDIDTDWVGKR